MLYNHLFWLAVALFFLSTINLHVYLDYRKTIRVLPILILITGILGMIGGLIRLIALSVAFNWWWFLGISVTSLLLIGILAYFSRIKGRLIVATINIALIPIIWWYGSWYSHDVPFGWFYETVDAVQAFFS